MTDFETTFTVHPLDDSSRFSLLGLLAGLYGLVEPPAEQRSQPDRSGFSENPVNTRES